MAALFGVYTPEYQAAA
ncbi:hypothetical protein [Mycobacterium lepromatosis]